MTPAEFDLAVLFFLAGMLVASTVIGVVSWVLCWRAERKAKTAGPSDCSPTGMV